MKKFYSNGKLLISGEYVVLDGATALAVPTSYGQSLTVEELDQKEGVRWKSYDHSGKAWIDETFVLNGENVSSKAATTDPKQKYIGQRLEQILTAANKLNPELLNSRKGYAVTTHLDFPGNWGLGSSSTLINNLADWFEIDAYELLKHTFGGSGYDIASAQNDHPITFSRKGDEVKTLTAPFAPSFKEELFFVHLNRKQSSRESIQHYRSQPKEKLTNSIDKISGITHQLIGAETVLEFELLLEIHEKIISTLINRPTIKSELFPDYPRKIKSLGGWGGDFILATGNEPEGAYFRQKGYNTIIPYAKMVL